MQPKKAAAPQTTFEQLIEKVRATFVDDVALKTKLGQLGNFSEEYHKELLAADTARFKDLDLFTGLTKKVPQTPATVERKGTKAADLKPDKPYGNLDNKIAILGVKSFFRKRAIFDSSKLLDQNLR